VTVTSRKVSRLLTKRNPIGISHETLHIDMRPLARNKLVNVEVMYELDNAGSTQQLELLFVTGANYVENFHVWLGEVELSTETSAVNIDELPPSWKPPTITPKIDSEQSNAYPNYYTDLPTQLVKFSAEIPSGKSQLKVAYQALAAQSYQVVLRTCHAPEMSSMVALMDSLPMRLRSLCESHFGFMIQCGWLYTYFAALLALLGFCFQWVCILLVLCASTEQLVLLF